MTTEGLRVDLPRFEAWLQDAIGPGSVTDATVLSGGTQNLLMRFRYAGRELVLRLPPAAKRTNSDETMRREARVLKALTGSDVPHPAFVASEPSLEPLGAAFLVMEAIDGVPATGTLAGNYGTDPAWRHAIGTSMAAGIAQLGMLDPDALGLADFGRPGPFLARQVDRWLGQLASYAGTPDYEPLEPDAVERISGWLSMHQPDEQPPGLLHGDFHTANVLLSPTTPRLAAIVDWELCTVGDPLLDLGQLLATWPDDQGPSMAVPSTTPADGFATEAEIVDAYRAVSSRDLSALAWYKTLAAFRLAAIIEGTWARACAGLADPSVGQLLHATAVGLLQRAEREIARS
jgi:aminoglycoside phosphotransferase (APT) family kinase protein